MFRSFGLRSASVVRGLAMSSRKAGLGPPLEITAEHCSNRLSPLLPVPLTSARKGGATRGYSLNCAIPETRLCLRLGYYKDVPPVPAGVPARHQPSLLQLTFITGPTRSHSFATQSAALKLRSPRPSCYSHLRPRAPRPPRRKQRTAEVVVSAFFGHHYSLHKAVRLASLVASRTVGEGWRVER